MLTPRAWWFLFWTGFLTLLGVAVFAFDAPTVPIFAFTLLIAFLAEWTLFAARVRSAAGRISVERQILVGDRELPALWAGTACTVRVRLRLHGPLRCPFVSVSDKVPAGQTIQSGSRRRTASLEPGRDFDLEYTLHPNATGIVNFEGIEIRYADLCGFFYHREFLRLPVEYLVLPPLTDDEGHQRATKRFNSLPPPGVHRLRRPGGGSELLDLREYRPGDPPKMIAWKASARRDRLITKEFENDVPVRCLVFLDASNATRLGLPGDTALSRMATLTAAVAQAAAANRDLVGLTIFHEQGTTGLKPARTRVHTMQLLRMVAETAGRPPDTVQADPALVKRLAYSLAQEQYPELLDRRANSRPLGLYWFPLLDTRLGWLLLIPVSIQFLMFDLSVVNELVRIARDIVKPRGLVSLIPMLLAFGILFYLPMLMAGSLWLLHGIRGFFAPHNKQTRRRKQLAAIYTTLDNDSPAAIERYLNDDAAFLERSVRFLADHHRQPPPILHDPQGNFLYRGDEKIPILANALVRAIGVARDNELYVVLADLVELTDSLEPFLKAVRAARARHHQILVMLAWPKDMPAPPDPKQPPRKKKAKRLTLGEVVGSVIFEGYLKKYERLRTALVRSGASLIRVNADEPVQLVLERLEQLRHARIRK